jgi:hypothetical protein
MDTAKPAVVPIDIAAEMIKETPENQWFHTRFNDVTGDIQFGDKKAVFIVRQLCYAFYMQGAHHAKAAMKAGLTASVNTAQALAPDYKPDEAASN